MWSVDDLAAAAALLPAEGEMFLVLSHQSLGAAGVPVSRRSSGFAELTTVAELRCSEIEECAAKLEEAVGSFNGIVAMLRFGTDPVEGRCIRVQFGPCLTVWATAKDLHEFLRSGPESCARSLEDYRRRNPLAVSEPDRGGGTRIPNPGPDPGAADEPRGFRDRR